MTDGLSPQNLLTGVFAAMEVKTEDKQALCLKRETTCDVYLLSSHCACDKMS